MKVETRKQQSLFLDGSVRAKCLYGDKFSLEKSTGNVKLKHKLAFNFIKGLEIYPFFVLRSFKEICSPRYRFEVLRADWISASKNICCLYKSVSYIDVRNPDIITIEELYKKRSRHNFFYIAELSQSKFNRLVDFCEVIKSTTSVNNDKKNLILLELTGDSDYTDDVDIFLGKYKI